MKKKESVKRFVPPTFQKILMRILLPALAAVWLACCIGTGFFAAYMHSREARDFQSGIFSHEYMLNRVNSRYASQGEDGSLAMSYACYLKNVQFYLRYSGVATALYDVSGEEGALLDSSEEKLFVSVEWADGTTTAFLSCDAEMDSAYYDFLSEFQNCEGKYFFRIPELYINPETWEFVPKKMYLSESFGEADEQSIFYENVLPPGEGFELVTAKEGTVRAYLPGTQRTRKAENRKEQDLYDARVASLEHLQSLSVDDIWLSTTVTYVSPKPWLLSGMWYYVSNLLRESRLESSVPVTLYDEAGNLNLYSMCQEHRYNIFRMYGTEILLGWFAATALCLGICAMVSYVSYSRQKSRWEKESYRRNLTNTMAHDLKSPLMAISGYAENLKENIYPEKKEYYTNAILECVEYMNSIVADILELGRLEQIEISLSRETFAAENLLGELAAYYQTKMDGKNLKFSMEGTCILSADPKLLKRAFDNLFHNAVNYTPEGNEIRVFLSSEQITFTNTGISMTREMCDKAFEPFVKEDGARSDQKGSGLGLAIAKQIFDAHGMLCRIESGELFVSVIVDVRDSK